MSKKFITSQIKHVIRSTHLERWIDGHWPQKWISSLAKSHCLLVMRRKKSIKSRRWRQCMSSQTTGTGAMRVVYRGTSFIRNSAPLGPFSRTTQRALWWPYGGGGVSYEQGTPVPSRIRARSGCVKTLSGDSCCTGVSRS